MSKVADALFGNNKPDVPEVPEFDPEAEAEAIRKKVAPPPPGRAGSIASIHAGPGAGANQSRTRPQVIGLVR